VTGGCWDAEFGDPDGKPILYFHGAHSSRLSGKVLAPVATKLNARVIAADRPGFGLSDFKSGHPIHSNRFRNDFLLERPGSTGNRIRTATCGLSGRSITPSSERREN